MASDPHLEINRLPAIWYEAVLRWGDSYVMGATLPGCPLFAVARTEKLAWGVTYMKGDTIDFFIEDCRQDEAGTWQYRRGTEWFDFRRRDEPIGRKGSEPEPCSSTKTIRAVLDGDPDQMGPGLLPLVPVDRQSWWRRSSDRTWLEVGAAENIGARDADRRAIVRNRRSVLCSPTSTGILACRAAGDFPSAANRTRDWCRCRPGTPRIIGRESSRVLGCLASTTRRMALWPPPTKFKTRSTDPCWSPSSCPTIASDGSTNGCSELPRATLSDMQALQYDLVSLQARDLLAVFLPHLPDGELKQRLENWDCRYDVESREASLFQRLYVNVDHGGLSGTKK